MKVVCFYWQGDRWQENGNHIPDDISFRNHLKRVGKADRNLVEKYINNLYKGVKRNASKDFEFICFSNEKLNLTSGIKIKPFTIVSKKGVLPRMYMFSEEAGLFGDQVLSLDLDVVITGSLKDIFDYNGLFGVRERWSPGQEHIPDGDVISFKAGKELEDIFWKPIIEDVREVERITKGRERFWVEKVIGTKADLFCNVVPGQIRSYKHHVKGRGLKNARIVSCHGFPRPHQINEKCIKENWI